jgi:hypothetical protein
MGTLIESDLIQGTRARRAADGWESIRTFVVGDLSGTADQKMYEAATTSGIPQYGTAHPTISGIQVVDIEASPIVENDQIALVTVQYRRPTPTDRADPSDDDSTPIRSISASLVEKISNRDSAGTLVTVTDGGDVQVAQFSVQKPVIVLTFERREVNFPKTRALTHVGNLNSSTFDGLSARTCLMTNISAETRDNGASWYVRYEVYHDPDGWDLEVFYRLPNGLPPDGLTPSVGIKTIQVIGTSNFSALSLV